MHSVAFCLSYADSVIQEAQLSLSDRAMRLVSSNLASCHATVLFCSLAVLDPRVGHTMDVLSPFIPVLCNSD